jgi:HSP20 family protein
MNPLDSWRRELTAPLTTLRTELNRLLPVHLGPRLGMGPSGVDEVATWTPAIDLYETPDEVGLWVDLPGVDPAAIELSLTGTVLTLRGQKATAGAPPDQGRVVERPDGPFLRRINLPAAVVADAVQAEAHLGVLHVRLPKVQPLRPRTIPIQTS